MTTAAAVRETGILFRGPLVVGILEGRKTETRRTRALDVVNGAPDAWRAPHQNDGGRWIFRNVNGADPFVVRCPYGEPGDRLWVRESWTAAASNPRAFGGIEGWCWWHQLPASMRGAKNAHALFYRADGVEVLFDGGGRDEDAPVDLVAHWPHLTMEQPRRPPRWLPSIHMPRWASRLLLDVLQVSVARVQDITTGQIWNEGVQIPVSERGSPLWRLSSPNPAGKVPSSYLPGDARAAASVDDVARAHWADLWDTTNWKRGFGWDLNPWVWVIRFRPAEVAR